MTQSSGVDVLVQGLCAFILGACYEFNREAGEITRATLQPILHKRIGADTFVSRMARVREDSRFKAVGPDVTVVDVMLEDVGRQGGRGGEAEAATDGEGEIWLDWAFVEFWKENYCEYWAIGNACISLANMCCLDNVQKSITADPNSTAAEAGQYAFMNPLLGHGLTNRLL